MVMQGRYKPHQSNFVFLEANDILTVEKPGRLILLTVMSSNIYLKLNLPVISLDQRNILYTSVKLLIQALFNYVYVLVIFWCTQIVKFFMMNIYRTRKSCIISEALVQAYCLSNQTNNVSHKSNGLLSKT